MRGEFWRISQKGVLYEIAVRLKVFCLEIAAFVGFCAGRFREITVYSGNAEPEKIGRT